MSKRHPYDWAVTGPPVGVWTSADGSFSVMMADTLTIRVDGTGSLHTHSVFSGDETVDLVWRHLSTGLMQIVCFYDGLLPDAITEDLWEPINYVADWCENDIVSGQPVLKNKHSDGFWALTSPMQLIAST